MGGGEDQESTGATPFKRPKNGTSGVDVQKNGAHNEGGVTGRDGNDEGIKSSTGFPHERKEKGLASGMGNGAGLTGSTTMSWIRCSLPATG
jgi:hypothetical protein